MQNLHYFSDQLFSLEKNCNVILCYAIFPKLHMYVKVVL